MKETRFVVIHKPGAKWIPGAPIFEQPGIQAHIDHYRKLLESGKLEMGGPFLDAGAGGMMVPTAGGEQGGDRSVRRRRSGGEVRPAEL